MNIYKCKVRIFLASLMISITYGCGGGSSGGGGGHTTPTERPAGTIKGVVTDAVVTNATVDFYRFSDNGKKEFLAETVKTDAEGRYTQSIKGKDGYVLITAKGGSYTEEFSGEIVNLDRKHVLKALTDYKSGNTIEVIPNPWSTVAFGYTECKIESGESIGNAHADSLHILSAIVGVPVLNTYPINPTHVSSSTYTNVDDGLKFGALAAGISKWTYDEAVKKGLKPHSPGFTSIDFALTMYEDIKADCKLDGYGLNANGARYQLGFGGRALNANVYRTELPRKMLEFMESDKNITQVGSSNLALYANQQATSTAQIFGNDKPEPLDEQGPFIKTNIVDGDYVYGNVDIQIDATDISGISSVKVIIGDQFESIIDGNNSEIEFPSKNYNDGPVDVAIEAIDGLNNISKQIIKLNIQNSKPIMKLKSKILVNNSEYDVELDVENIPQRIKSASINGEVLNIDRNYMWGTVGLKQGYNDLNITLIDMMGIRSEYSKQVFLDVIEPSIDPRVPSKHPEEQFQVRYLPNGVKDPVWRNFKEKSDEGIFVPRDRRDCGSTLLEEDKLKELGWPYVSIKPLDAGDSFDGVLRAGNLNVTYTYEVGDEIRINRRSGALKNGTRFMVPFCSEFLGADWWKANDRSATTKITFYVTDQAGNESNTEFEFSFSENSTTFEPVLGNEVYFSSDADLISFDATGMEGVDRVELYIDGEYHGNIVDYETGTAHISAEDFKDGLHEAYFVIKDNGKVILKTEPTKFRVDNTPPTVQLISKPISGTKRYVIEFSADDGEGAGFDMDSLTVSNRSLDSQLFKKIIKTDRNTYTVAVDLVPGINPLIFDFKDKVGNEQRMVFDNVGYDASAPVLTWNYPNNSMKVFGYSKDDPHNPVILQPFMPTGTPYPLYLNDEMINFKPTGQASFQNFRPFGDNRVGWRAVIVPSVSDKYDISEWGRVGSDHLKIHYEVFVEDKDEPVHTAEITEPRFGYSGVITVNREDMGDDFYRINETTKVTVKVHLEDEVGHTSTYEVDFKVYFDPGSPTISSIIHSDTTSLANTFDLNNIDNLNRDLKTHELKLTNMRLYPVWVNLQDAGHDQVKVSRDEGRMANIYREVNIFERTLVKGNKLEQGRGYNGFNPNYFLIEYDLLGDNWSSDIQVMAGSTNIPLEVMENSKGRIEKPYTKHYGNPPGNTISSPSFLDINSNGAIVVKNYDYVNASGCPAEPDQCWRESGTRSIAFKGEYGGYFIKDNKSVLVRERTLYEIMPGYPKPELKNKTSSYPSNRTELSVSGSNEIREINGREWYLLNPGESINVSRSINFLVDTSLGDCNWVYATVKSCLRQISADIGGALKVSTRIQTLDGKLGTVVKTTTHQLEKTQLKFSR
jgi:hypothetical protein